MNDGTRSAHCEVRSTHNESQIATPRSCSARSSLRPCAAAKVGRMRIPGMGRSPDTRRGARRMTLILPERRRKRRYVTLKNAGIAAVAVVVAFLLLSVWSAARPDAAASRSLLSSRVQSHDSMPIGHDPMTVSEGPVDDHPGYNPRLLDARALDQLQAPTPSAPAQQPSAATAQTTFEPLTSHLGKGQRITISGGINGVQIHAEPMSAPSAPAQKPLTATPEQPVPPAQPR